ncbi:hypothetical protein PAXINDRAFT_153506 [Paxillus involutus ATCC 200175]|nr:hypothetical protein PAXINDRAFT_153506 [Paxillus involutus ATCC 200175]
MADIDIYLWSMTRGRGWSTCLKNHSKLGGSVHLENKEAITLVCGVELFEDAQVKGVSECGVGPANARSGAHTLGDNTDASCRRQAVWLRKTKIARTWEGPTFEQPSILGTTDQKQAVQEQASGGRGVYCKEVVGNDGLRTVFEVQASGQRAGDKCAETLRG